MSEFSQKSATKRGAYIAQGEYAVSVEPGAKISTILGSCVATCLWDPEAQVGGMNHFLLPDGPTSTPTVSSFGANAMELLINAMIKAGAQRERLRAKVFGGAEMYKGLTKAGAQNGDFVLNYLKLEGIPCDGQSLGGNSARRIEFFAAEGKARQKIVEDAQLQEKRPNKAPDSTVELF